MVEPYEPIRRVGQVGRQLAPGEPDPSAPPPDNKTILDSIISTSLSGLGMAGNLLDLPGSMVRDTITGNNPFDQLLSPLSHENRMTGRDVLSTYGLASENKETGWVPLEDPVEFGQDALGFAAELALDPLAWITGWMKASSRAAAAANVAEDVSKVAKATGKVAKTTAWDKFGNAINSIDPGFHVGKFVRTKYGDDITEAVAKVGEMDAPKFLQEPLARWGPSQDPDVPLKVKEIRKAAKDRAKHWAHKFDGSPLVSMDILEADLIEFKKDKMGGEPIVHASQKVLTDFTPMQALARRIAAGFGADLYFWGGGTKSGAAGGAARRSKGNRIWISGDRRDAGILDIVGHETLHIMRNHDPEAFEKLLTNVLEKADDPQAFMEAAIKSYGDVVETYSPGLQVEEGVAMTAGRAFDDPKLWKAISRDRSVQPVFQRAFSEAIEMATKHATTTERKLINEHVGQFMYGQRAATAADATPESLAKEAMDMLDDPQKVANYQKGMEQVVTHPTADPTRIQRAGMVADDVARNVLLSAEDMGERLNLSLKAQMYWRVLGRTTKEGQAMGKHVTDTFEQLGPQFTEAMHGVSDQLMEIGKLGDKAAADDLRYAIETDTYRHLEKYFDDPEAANMFQQATRAMKQTIHRVHTLSEAAGLKSSILDDVHDWFARGMTPEALARADAVGTLGKGTESKGLRKLFAALQSGRRTTLFRGSIHATRGFNELTGDINILGAIRNNNKVAAVARMAKQFGKTIDPRLPHMDVTGGEKKFLVRHLNLRDMDNALEYIEDADLFREYQWVPTGVDMFKDEAARLQVYQDPLKMERKQQTLPDTRDLTAKKLRDMGIDDEDLLDAFEHIEDFEAEDLANLIEDGEKAVRHNHALAQQIELVTHVTPIPEEIAKKAKNKITGGRVKTRFEGIADWIEEKKIAGVLESQGGLFRNNAIAEIANRLQSEVYKASTALGLTRLFANMFDTGTLATRTAGTATGVPGRTLKDLFDQDFAHLSRKKIYNNMRGLSKEIDNFANAHKDDWQDLLGNMSIDHGVYEDLTAVADFHNLPESTKGLMNMFRSVTSLFKAGVLTHPARYSRDFFSGQVANYLNNMFSFEAAFRAKDVLMNNPNEALVQMPELRLYAEGIGMKEAAFKQINVGDAVDHLYGSTGAPPRVVNKVFMKEAPDSGKIGHALLDDGREIPLYHLEKHNPFSPGDTVDWNGASHKIESLDAPTEASGRRYIKLADDAGFAPLDELKLTDTVEDWFTPAMATHAARGKYASLKGDAHNMQRDANLEELGRTYTEASGAEAVGESQPGTHQSLRAMGQDIRRHLRFGTDPVTGERGSRVPWDVEGNQYWGVTEGSRTKAKQGMVRRKGQTGFKEFAWVEVGHILQKNSDDMNRLVGWMEGMRQGKPAAEAFKDVTRVQLDYRPHTFGPLEKSFLKKIFPFYSFFTRESAYLANELLTNPAGRLGKLIRLQSKAAPGSDPDQYVPEHVREQMAIPIGESADGGRNYLTGIGLMHEDPLSMIFGGLSDSRKLFRNTISKTNPLLKAIPEWGLGVSSFQGGPMGGRDISSQDPLIGRILTNLKLREKLPNKGARPFISRSTEFIAANSPVSRLLSSLRTATDVDAPYIGLEGRKKPWMAAFNLLTGARITSVSPEQARGALRQIGNAIARDAGAREFSSYDPSTELIERIAKTDPETADQLMYIKRQRTQWNKERRQDIRRSDVQSALAQVKAGESPDLNKGQTDRSERWIKKFGASSAGSESWAQYVFQSELDGNSARSGIKDWEPGIAE